MARSMVVTECAYDNACPDAVASVNSVVHNPEGVLLPLATRQEWRRTG